MPLQSGLPPAPIPAGLANAAPARPRMALVFCPVVAGGDKIGFVWNLRPNLAAARTNFRHLIVEIFPTTLIRPPAFAKLRRGKSATFSRSCGRRNLFYGTIS